MYFERSSISDLCEANTAGYSSSLAAKSYLDGLPGPLTETFMPQRASALLEHHADSEPEAHTAELRQKANDGTLIPQKAGKHHFPWPRDTDRGAKI
jgi:hypothetical protein